MFDAHSHTNCSDGNVTIEERIQLIRDLGYEAATITDHDFISEEQVQRARSACGDLTYVPGIELSLAQQGKVVHLLGYFVDPGDTSLQTYLQHVQAHDREVTTRLLTAFQNMEFEGKTAQFSMEDLEADSLHTFYSMQLVRRLAAGMYAADPQALLPAFLHVLHGFKLTYADLAPWSVRDAIDLIHQAGGIAVLAHPGGRDDPAMQALGFLWHDQDQIQTYLAWGLDGVETRTPVHNVAERTYYENLAHQLHLLKTSGSDCHGDDPYLGPALMGSFRDLYEGLYQEMLTVLHQRFHS